MNRYQKGIGICFVNFLIMFVCMLHAGDTIQSGVIIGAVAVINALMGMHVGIWTQKTFVYADGTRVVFKTRKGNYRNGEEAIVTSYDKMFDIYFINFSDDHNMRACYQELTEVS